jgi:hypothetical protein
MIMREMSGEYISEKKRERNLKMDMKNGGK